ncbi:MAG: serine/threonine-protein kinase, partial [Rubripirellula sp.]
MAGDFRDADSQRNSETRSGDSSSSVGPLPDSTPSSYVVLPTSNFDTPVTGRADAPPLERTRASGGGKSSDPEHATIRNREAGLRPISSIVGTSLKEGKRVDFGDYELLEEIARGGMGVVFRAIQKGLNRSVALKVILAGQFATDEDVQRFQSEAEAAAILQHPAIVPIYEVGQCEGHHFFSMGLVTGSTLANAVRDRPMMGQEAARILSDVAGAIAFAHAHGVVHRDLKPGNILLDKSARPHVTDFGLAKRADTDSQLTGTGQVIGTPNYMAPEQASGLNHLIGARSDVYSLGAVLYFTLTGRPPFHATGMMETLQQVISQDPVPPHRLNGSIDEDIETICLKCLQKDPGARYQSAADLQADLERYRNLEPIEARPITRAARGWRWCRRNPGTALLSGTLAVVTLALAIGGPIFSYRERLHAMEAVELKNEAEASEREAEASAIEAE